MADLLVDEGIGVHVVQHLRGLGLQAVHALEALPKGSRDSHVFSIAQARALTVFTWNREDYILLAYAWRDWGHGDHHGITTRRPGRPQMTAQQTIAVLTRFCTDSSSYINRVELF
jgi:hypothetical protein